jgi:putative transposase
VFSKIRNENKFLDKRQACLLNFVLMPNHFHFLLREESEHGVSDYLRRVQDGYTKYFNAKYGKSGHLFQGPFKAVHVKNNDQLLYLSSYIHKNPKELKNGIEYSYQWSSFQDYILDNRWGALLESDTILRQFKNEDKYKYKYFVKISKAKELLKELNLD